MRFFQDISIGNLKKYFNYAFESKSFLPHVHTTRISDHAAQTAAQIRGPDRKPAIIIHGIMPRSGTVYVGELLRLHPDICAYPREIWELPFLQHTGDLLRLHQQFFLDYEENQEKIGESDFLPIFGASIIAYLHGAIPPGRRMLLKIPSVRYLNHFYSVFPHEHLLVLVRDGRDLAQSTVKTWPQLRFSMVCRRWSLAARMILACDRVYRGRSGYWLTRFEDVIHDPVAFVRRTCERFDLDVDRYPFEKIQHLPVRGASSLTDRGNVAWMPRERPRGFNPTGYWRDWSPPRKWVLKALAGQALIDLGYCEDLSW